MSASYIARSFEDQRWVQCEKLAALLRARPLLPGNPATGFKEPWTDIDAGLRFPLVTCAFCGCGWKGKHEEELSLHLLTTHMDTFKSIVERAPSHNYVAYYYQAIAIRERGSVPVLSLIHI